MKILHVLYSGLGGHGSVFFSFINADAKKEFEYEALFIGIEDVKPEYIQRCQSANISWNFIKKEKTGLHLKFYRQISYVIEQSDADTIFLHSSSYLLAAIMANRSLKKKKKIIIRETQANNLKTKQNWFWLAISFFFAHKIVFLSEEYKTEIKRKLIGFYKESKVAVIPNGIDLNVYKPRLHIKQDVFTIGMQSRLTDNKDHVTLIKAFAQLKKNKQFNIKLVIAGDGPCKEGLIALAQKLKIADDIQFMGMLPEDQLVKFLQTLYIYVHASFGETMSTSIMQAMACSLPIVASDVPGINNMIIDNETGCLIQVRDEEKLFMVLDSLLCNSTKTEHLAQNAFNYAQKHYSNLVMFKKYKGLFSA